MVLQEKFVIACGLFLLTSLTDLLDGYIARNWKGQSSILGSVLDPLVISFWLLFCVCLSLQCNSFLVSVKGTVVGVSI
ncbi:CRLS1 [Bugula neritina]|uniref:CRLS1 n=1 Tax=Bugula neritina TaxID=10212 RepID=A0A7J7KJF0_BUGNE|nr:CRLS1 [Bugula neritina]